MRVQATRQYYFGYTQRVCSLVDRCLVDETMFSSIELTNGRRSQSLTDSDLELRVTFTPLLTAPNLCQLIILFHTISYFVWFKLIRQGTAQYFAHCNADNFVELGMTLQPVPSGHCNTVIGVFLQCDLNSHLI